MEFSFNFIRTVIVAVEAETLEEARALAWQAAEDSGVDGDSAEWELDSGHSEDGEWMEN